ncbi:MAG: hypothetical protein QXL77_05370 [Candidatus Bathyarchaeia archaeon]
MKCKLAVITAELVDESLAEKTETIQKELMEWFEENCHVIPWVKKVKSILVKEG